MPRRCPPQRPTRMGMERRLRGARTDRPPATHAYGDGAGTLAALADRFDSDPRVWGWSVPATIQSSNAIQRPTRMGMERAERSVSSSTNTATHAYGDGAARSSLWSLLCFSDPRVWGWSVPSNLSPLFPAQRPTRMGMERCRPIRVPSMSPATHAYGDGSGCASRSSARSGQRPTRMGMDRVQPRDVGHGPPATHAYGDGSDWRDYDRPPPPSDPRVWGWISRVSPSEGLGFQRPTRMGMDRNCRVAMNCIPSATHAYGDGSLYHDGARGRHHSDPRVWGWSGRMRLLSACP